MNLTVGQQITFKGRPAIIVAVDAKYGNLTIEIDGRMGVMCGPNHPGIKAVA